MRQLKLAPKPEATAVPPLRSYAGQVVDQLVREAEMDTPVSSYLVIKRGLDCVLALFIGLLAAPVTLVAMLLVRATSRGPAIYTQTRVGYGGRLFTIYKIRTMIHNCESLTGPRWCVPGDPRVTPVGGVLRTLHIDELPQLWNVLRGDMSLVGPRPERPEFVSRFVRQIPHYQARHSVFPGITGLAQLFLPPDTEVAHVERKLVFDLQYARNPAVSVDLRILLCTALKLLGVPAAVLRAVLPATTDEASPTLARRPRRAA